MTREGAAQRMSSLTDSEHLSGSCRALDNVENCETPDAKLSMFDVRPGFRMCAEDKHC